MPANTLLNTPSPAAHKLEALRQLFPQAVEVDADGRVRVNAALLQLALDPANPAGIRVEEDGYELRWVGKREAYHSAFVPAQKIVKPLAGDSVHWADTGNLLLKGDNLDALRLLRQSYFGQVKLIYIDPPYNTQSDAFIYRDDFSARQGEVLAQLGYGADSVDYIKNIYGARTHSGWLSFMYPRLLLAKDLLRDDGVIFISIDDNEQAPLKLLCDEVFGEENFVANVVWQRSKKGDTKLISTVHEYILCYVNDKAAALDNGQWRRPKEGADAVLAQYETLKAAHANDHDAIRAAMMAWFRSLPATDPRKAHKHYTWSDDRGLYFADNFAGPDDGRASRPRHDIPHPVTGLPCKKPSTGWRWDEEKTRWALSQQPPRIHFGADETTIPTRKSYLAEIDSEPYSSVFYRDGRSATLALEALIGKGCFPFPKNADVLSELIQLTTGRADLVLDFFAGSGTTAEAVMRLNAEDGGNRQFILVQIPQAIDPKKQKEAHAFVTETLGKPEATIFEITAERIRRAGAKLQAERAAQVQAQGELLATEIPALDTGFRVFELVDDPDALILQKPLHEATQDDLLAYQTRIATPQPAQLDRVLHNLLLAEGLPLTTRLQTIVDEALYLAADVAILVRSMPLTELTDLLRGLRAAVQPVQHLTVYAPWISDDNFLLGLKTLAESLGLADNALHLRG
ncbi:site-specific DNA-methyltransferase [Malikia sp.]|uniref:site-specific DNA-methyltransferase n=1 Tax=Malikia sp. TaxID=2070706 RepID=UPI00261D3172|nr:site-specific DNA-methyltransferase [Malikia sp.]MDD2727941.1 site-specific DNA-methyltransferase [Malikia sp.]